MGHASKPMQALAVLAVTAALSMGIAACAGTSKSAPSTTGAPQPSTTVSPSAPLVAPRTSTSQDAQFFSEVTQADPALVTYEQQHGTTALKALLTDGSAFCGFLGRGGGIDTALVDVAIGARSTEAQTQLPLTVRTFNAIESVSLLTLCPGELTKLPSADQAKIIELGQALAAHPA